MLSVRVLERKSGGIIAEFSNVERIDSEDGYLHIFVFVLYLDKEYSHFVFPSADVNISVNIQ